MGTLLSAGAIASVLTFEIDGIGNFGSMPDEYGDRITAVDDGSYHYEIGVEGATPNVVVTYPRVPANSADPSYWSTGYGDLVDVYFEDNDGVGQGEIILSADYGYEVVLYGFQMAAYTAGFGSDPVINAVRVLGCSDTPIFEETDAAISISTHTDYNFSSAPIQSREIRIQFDSANLVSRSDDIALDNIRFGQVAVSPTEMPCPSDIAIPLCVLDVFDAFAFLDLFNAGDIAADFTGDGSLDVFDVFAFLDEFNAGCDE